VTKAAVILADPPWPYNDRKAVRRDNPARAPKFGLGVERRYSAGTMSIQDLSTLPVSEVVTPDAYLFLWATAPRLPAAFELLSAWGFRYATVQAVWVKAYPGRLEALRSADDLPGVLFRGPGRYSPSNVELLLLGVRGRCWHPAEGFKPRQVIVAPHPRDPLTGKIRHSRKPEAFQDDLDRWLRPCASGEFLELFATRERPGWRCLGHALTGTDIRDDLHELAILWCPGCHRTSYGRDLA